MSEHFQFQPQLIKVFNISVRHQKMCQGQVTVWVGFSFQIKNSEEYLLEWEKRGKEKYLVEWEKRREEKALRVVQSLNSNIRDDD